MDAHHHHPGDPEEDDVEPGDQHVPGIVALQLRRLIRPAKSGKGPEGGGEPGVQHVLVAGELDVVTEPLPRSGPRRPPRPLAHHRAAWAVPSRALLPPPTLQPD